MRKRRVVAALLYWLAVLVISVALVLALLLWLESRDESSVGARLGSDELSRANTTMRSVAR